MKKNEIIFNAREFLFLYFSRMDGKRSKISPKCLHKNPNFLQFSVCHFSEVFIGVLSAISTNRKSNPEKQALGLSKIQWTLICFYELGTIVTCMLGMFSFVSIIHKIFSHMSFFLKLYLKIFFFQHPSLKIPRHPPFFKCRFLRTNMSDKNTST